MKSHQTKCERVDYVLAFFVIILGFVIVGTQTFLWVSYLEESKGVIKDKGEEGNMTSANPKISNFNKSCSDLPTNLRVYKTGAGLLAGLMSIFLGTFVCFTSTRRAAILSLAVIPCIFLSLVLHVLLVAVVFSDVLKFKTLCSKSLQLIFSISSFFAIFLTVALCISFITSPNQKYVKLGMVHPNLEGQPVGQEEEEEKTQKPQLIDSSQLINTNISELMVNPQ